MGLFSDKLKYFRAYRSIKTVGEAIRDMNGTIENIYLIDINQIPNFLAILNKYEILEKITDRSKRSLVSELENKLKDDFSKYELEKEIETIYLDSNVYEKRKDDIFILVDKDFLVNMKVEIKNGYKIIFNKDIKKIELPNEVFIKIEESEKKSIYKFAGIMDKSFDPNAVSHIEQEEEEDEEKDEFRVKPKKKAEEEEEEEEKRKEEEEEKRKKEEEEKRKKEEEEQERKKKEESNIINILIDDVDDEAQTAKFDEILESIFFSLQNSNEQREIICEEIKRGIVNAAGYHTRTVFSGHILSAPHGSAREDWAALFAHCAGFSLQYGTDLWTFGRVHAVPDAAFPCADAHDAEVPASIGLDYSVHLFDSFVQSSGGTYCAAGTIRDYEGRLAAGNFYQSEAGIFDSAVLFADIHDQSVEAHGCDGTHSFAGEENRASRP